MGRSITIKHILPDGYKPIVKGGCTAGALTHAIGIPYLETLDLMMGYGLSKKGGIVSFPIWCDLFGVEKVKEQKLSIGKSLEKYNKGTYIFHKRGHVFCVKDGVILDWAHKIGKNTIIDYVVDCN